MSQIIKGTVSGAQNVRGTIKEIPHLDKTLTKEGYAADAKAVGVALENKAPISHTEDKNNPHGVTASQVGARPDTWMPSASEIGAATMEYAKKVGNPYNLLDNSDFQNPVNQRGFVSGSEVPAGAYFIDRWRNSYSGVSQYPVLDGNGISNLTEVVEQPVDLSAYVGKPVTIAIYENCDKPICCASGVVVKSAEWNAFAFSSNWEVRVYTANNVWLVGVQVPCKYIALYPGEYTLDTLPVYQPNGYAAEYAECRRYYRHNVTVNITRHSADYYAVGYEHDMRIAPTVEPTSAVIFGSGAITDMTGASFECTTHKITWALLPAVAAANWTHANFNLNLHADL